MNKPMLIDYHTDALCVWVYLGQIKIDELLRGLCDRCKCAGKIDLQGWVQFDAPNQPVGGCIPYRAKVRTDSAPALQNFWMIPQLPCHPFAKIERHVSLDEQGEWCGFTLVIQVTGIAADAFQGTRLGLYALNVRIQ